MSCKNILIIDDDAPLRQTMREALECEGYQVFTAVNGKDGFDKLKTISPEPCVILLDLMMPVMSGWDFLDSQRSHPDFKDIPVVICSGYCETAKAIRPAAVIEKPMKLESLLNTVTRFCA